MYATDSSIYISEIAQAVREFPHLSQVENRFIERVFQTLGRNFLTEGLAAGLKYKKICIPVLISASFAATVAGHFLNLSINIDHELNHQVNPFANTVLDIISGVYGAVFAGELFYLCKVVYKERKINQNFSHFIQNLNHSV